MYGQLPKQNIDRRREMVRHLHYTGISVPLIVERLEKHDVLFSITADYDEKYATIANDVAVIKKEAMERIAIVEFDAKEQHALYIDRQTFLYHQSLQDGNLALARVLSMDIAKSYGVVVDEPIATQENLLSLLRGAREKGQQRLEERKLIDITPETISDTIKPQADVIFNKR